MKLYKRLIIGFIASVRPFLGSLGSCCIYPLSCSDFAYDIIKNKPFYKALPIIIFRVLSCNPINACYRRWSFKKGEICEKNNTNHHTLHEQARSDLSRSSQKNCKKNIH